MYKNDYSRKIDISNIAKRKGISKAALQEYIDKLVKGGFFIHKGKDMYDISPYVNVLTQYTSERREGKEVDIKELVDKTIGR
ncbi:hypothetical protein [Halobacillus sp. A5]|uniref:hypothetical protein n=1 Tax=Halobacillus sp. A5 TaxID=2880263 RepID=UPI0020A6BBCB|nr:hypothetical protein [Halobacillus sp. A5]MCP3026907.1 hypothetical protein [Halobacillus sp. A5]